MQTISEPGVTDRSPASFRSIISPVPVSVNRLKRLRIKEYISWSVCFGVVSLLTGLLMFLKLGVTMESVTDPLFFLSLAGFVYFMTRILRNSRHPSFSGTTTSTN